MTHRNVSGDLLDIDTDDFSLETTVPTDLSLSPDTASEADSRHNKKKRHGNSQINRQLLERKQLLHDMQVILFSCIRVIFLQYNRLGP